MRLPDPAAYSEGDALPAVSVIVAARNEEAALPALLASLAALDYPKGRLQFVFGDDASTDRTHAILQEWTRRLPDCHIHSITGQVSGLTSKGNVLAQLCRHATGDVFLFTDADCAVPPGWARNMAQPFLEDERLGILTGITLPEHHTPFERMQAVDWINAQYVIYVMSLLRWPITAMGNNMAITARAYRASGGFEATADSITEDHAIFHHIIRRDIGWAHRFDTSVMAATLPQRTRAEWLEQRVRWFSGAMKLPLHTQFPFWMQLSFYPLLLLSLPFIGWQWALFAVGMKVGFQTLLFMAGMAALRQWRLLPWALYYEPWSVWACWVLWLRWRKSPVIEWKGREFAKRSA